MASDLDPEVDRVLELRAENPRFPYHTLSVESAREAFRDHMTADAQPPPVGSVREVSIGDTGPSVRLRLYTPEADPPHPVLVYFHGGGWVLGSLDTHDALCRELARRAEAMVISVGYRRAPEHPFPAAVRDAYRAVQWAADNVTYSNGDPGRIAVGGDSVGGTLATVVTMLAREWDGPSIIHQLLLHPVTDSRVEGDSYDEYGSGYIGSKAGMNQYWGYYRRDEFDHVNPYAAPIRARDLSGLPPAQVYTCEYDPLRDEGTAYAERLRDADVLRAHTHEKDVFHGYFVSVQFLDRAKRGVAEFAQGLRSVFQDAE